MVPKVGLGVVVGGKDQLPRRIGHRVGDNDIFAGRFHDARDDRDKELELDDEQERDGERHDQRGDRPFLDDEDQQEHRQEKHGDPQDQLHIGAQGEFLHDERDAPIGQRCLDVRCGFCEGRTVVGARDGKVRHYLGKVHNSLHSIEYAADYSTLFSDGHAIMIIVDHPASCCIIE